MAVVISFYGVNVFGSEEFIYNLLALITSSALKT